jgi:hypothetical protein
MNEIKFDARYRNNLNVIADERKSYFYVENKYFKIELWKTTADVCKLSSPSNITAVKVSGLIHESNISEFKLDFPYKNEFVLCETDSHWNKSSNFTTTYTNQNPDELGPCLNKFINKFLTVKEKPIFLGLINFFINPLETWIKLTKSLNDPSLPHGTALLAIKLLSLTPSMMINKIVEKLYSESYIFSNFDNELDEDEVLEIRTKLKDELWSDLTKAGCSKELIFEANMLLYPDDFPKENL